MGTGKFGSLKSVSRVLGIVATTIVAGIGPAGAGDLIRHQATVSGPVPRSSIETVYFTDRDRTPVRVVRGTVPIAGLPMRREIMTFGGETAQHVTVFRGEVEPVSLSGVRADKAAPSPQDTIERIDPADPARARLAMLRGGAAVRGLASAYLYSPALDEHFGRIAGAVHAVESRYGTDLRMWRLDNLSGPQGPMQVSAAAALDVGGGNRFDLYENIVLGRAYLVRLFRRYGNWSDALAAYNWGPGNVDQWIARGRIAQQLPSETTRYIERVLQLAFLGPAAGMAQQRIAKQ